MISTFLSIPYLISTFCCQFLYSGEGEVYMLGGNHLGVLSDLQNISPQAMHVPGNALELTLNNKDIIIFVLPCCIHL